MTYLSLKTLQEKGACWEERERFLALFGEGVDVTPGLCEKYASEFDFVWAADNLLEDEGARKNFNDAYHAAHGIREVAYRKVHNVISCTCGEDCAKIGKEFDLTIARAFAVLYCVTEAAK